MGVLHSEEDCSCGIDSGGNARVHRLSGAPTSGSYALAPKGASRTAVKVRGVWERAAAPGGAVRRRCARRLPCDLLLGFRCSRLTLPTSAGSRVSRCPRAVSQYFQGSDRVRCLHSGATSVSPALAPYFAVLVHPGREGSCPVRRWGRPSCSERSLRWLLRHSRHLAHTPRRRAGG